MRINAGVVAVLLLLATRTTAAQQSPCVLLTSGDIEAATGAKPGDPRATRMTVSDGPAKGATMLSCSWPEAATRGMVTANLMPALTGAAHEAGLARLRQTYDKLRAQNWTEMRKDYGSARCSTLTPPPSQTNVPMVSACFAESKGKALSVVILSPARNLTPDQAKSLMDKALGRLT